MPTTNTTTSSSNIMSSMNVNDIKSFSPQSTQQMQITPQQQQQMAALATNQYGNGQTQEFMTLYQKLYAQYAQTFPFLNPQVLALQAQAQTLRLLGQETPNVATTSTSPKISANTVDYETNNIQLLAAQQQQQQQQALLAANQAQNTNFNPTEPRRQWSTNSSKLEIIDDRSATTTSQGRNPQAMSFDAFSSNSSTTSYTTGTDNLWNRNSTSNNDVWS